MDFTVIADYAWIIWLVLIGLFLVIEMFTLEFTCLMLALGSAVGLVANLLGAPWWLQIIVAAIAALVLILLLRPPLLRRLGRSGDPTPSNIDALIGMRGVVVQTVDAAGGQVKLTNGDIWTARTRASTLPPATEVSVVVVSGALIEVTPTIPQGA